MSLEQFSKATRETAEKLRIIDDALFRLMAVRKGVCQEILRTLLDMPELTVVRVTVQSTVPSLHRGIILDALCILENGEYVNIEMQKESCNDDIMRTRYHAAALTTAYTPKGTTFADIPQVTILYITEYDALNSHQAITRVKRCMETKEGFVPVQDKEDIFFANTQIKEDTDKSELLQLFLRKDVFEDAKFPKLSEAVKYFKKTEGGRAEVCKIIEDYAKEYAAAYGAECEEKGRAEGREEGRLHEIFRSVQDGDYTVKRGAQKANMEDSEFEKKMTEAGYKIPECV